MFSPPPPFRVPHKCAQEHFRYVRDIRLLPFFAVSSFLSLTFFLIFSARRVFPLHPFTSFFSLCFPQTFQSYVLTITNSPPIFLPLVFIFHLPWHSVHTIIFYSTPVPSPFPSSSFVPSLTFPKGMVTTSKFSSALRRSVAPSESFQELQGSSGPDGKPTKGKKLEPLPCYTLFGRPLGLVDGMAERCEAR